MPTRSDMHQRHQNGGKQPKKKTLGTTYLDHCCLIIAGIRRCGWGFGLLQNEPNGH